MFGLTEAHGDDALRASRAALKLRARARGCGSGMESGEVFLGSGPHGATIATGAAITAAGRLAERAGARRDPARRGRSPARSRPTPASTTRAVRLLELRVEQPALLRTPATPFVGRAASSPRCTPRWPGGREERACGLVTVAGPPGIGKSRLAGEFVAALGDEATVLGGRCLAYGEGTTYRALADIVRGLGGDPRAAGRGAAGR